MGANNFYPHENGIYVIEGAREEDVFQELVQSFKEEGQNPEDITDQDVYSEMNFLDELTMEEFFMNMEVGLPHGMTMVIHSKTSAEVLSKQGKTIAMLELRAGYYEDAQVIVETDPEEIFGDYYPETQTELLEQYTPNHQRLLKYISEFTTPIIKVGGFSNGTAVYKLA